MNGKHLTKRFFLILGSVLITIILIDVLTFMLTPVGGLSFLPTYKYHAPSISIQKLIRQYPKGYHLEDSQMGFDIAPNQAATEFFMPDKTVTIFSNALSCMDHLTLQQIQNARSYEYITGDSFTWGYADYEYKYPKVYERSTGKTIAKCGITHSGQSHQFDKFNRVVKEIGYYPKRVIVSYFENDVINDYLYPHTTVIEGFQVDRFEVGKHYDLYRRDLNQIHSNILESLNQQMVSTGTQNEVHIKNIEVNELINWLQRNSMSFNLLKYGFDQFGLPAMTNYRGEEVSSDKIPKPVASELSIRYPIYKLSEKVRFNNEYRTMPITQANRLAIMRWAKDSRARDYELIFMIIPNKGNFNQADSYSGLRLFLREQGIPYLNMAQVFHDSGKSVDAFYWPQDGHWNNSGNEFVGAFLARQFRN